MNTIDTLEKKEESSQSGHQNYKERTSKLQYEITPWGTLHFYEGFWIASGWIEGFMYVQDNLSVTNPTDILLCSAPKSGTTWLKALAFAITTRSKFEISSSPLLKANPHDCVPFLELIHAPDSPIQRDQELPLLATHIPYTSLPRSIITSNCKIIYIYREPKDVLVSLWHFMSTFVPKDKVPLKLDVFYELFIKGVSIFGSYWDHVLSYWKASLERPKTILLLKYEDLMNDTIFYVKKIAEFMGCAFSENEEKGGVVEKLVTLCNFENLSNLSVNKTGKYRIGTFDVANNNTFFRKGRSGDWQNHLTPEMVENIDKISVEKFGSCGLMELSTSRTSRQ